VTVLAGIRIVDVSQGLPGPLAARLLAEAGAEVIKVEPPSGDRARRMQPAGFASWNRSKRGVVLDLDASEDRARLDELLSGADVLVHDLTPARSAAVGLDDVSLAARHPDLIAAGVAGYPPDHADAERSDDDLLVQARVGLLDEVLPPGDPVFVPLPMPSLHAAYLLAGGILARLDLRARTGRVGAVHTSLAQGAWANLTMLWNRAERPEPSLGPGVLHLGQALTLGRECGDGEWVVQGTSPIPAMRSALDRLDPPGRPDDPVDLARALRTRTAKEWVRLFGEADQQCMEILRPGECLRHPQVVANGFVTEVDDPVLGPTVQAGPPIGIEPPCEVRGPAPALDPRARPVFRSPGRAWPEATGPLPRYPLEGLRVLDLGMFLAGPFGPQCLADLGADVIKVEPPTGDRMRGASQLFVGCQRNKRSIGLDLKDPASRPVLERLVRWADVVHHNQRRPPAAALGLDEASIRSIKHDVVFCHTSTYGPEGEMADWPGVDHDGVAASGWMWVGAGEGNDPLWHPWGWCDYQCALASMVATLLGVFRRTTSGEGSSVTASLLGAAVATTDRVLLADGTVSGAPGLDAARRGVSPDRRLYRCADGWVAVAADRNGSGPALRAVAGVAADDALPDAFATRPAEAVRAALDAAGVPAEVVRRDQRVAFFDDQELRRLGYTVAHPHPDWGVFEQPGAYWTFSELAVRLDAAPPVLGGDARGILAELGLSSDEADALIRQGVVVAAE
jgi:crotonobetainyl-CoA:carnitine CoA-transferase CaiB-like acyl-CoA transferase